MMDGEPSIVLRSDARLIRDAYVRQDGAEGPILGIRQISRDEAENSPQVKIIRLAKKEADSMFKFWAAHRENGEDRG